MSSIQRLTLISDPTDEFPKNANNNFKVRLPERLSLPGEGWHASLMSVTVPNQGQSNAVIATDPHTKVIRFKFTQVIRWYQLGFYRRVETPAIDALIELENIMNADQIVATGSMFWKRVMQEVNNKIVTIVATKQRQLLVSRRDERPVVSVKKNGMPQLTWKDDTLVIHALAKEDLLNVHNIAMAEFHINLDIALKFGLVIEKTGQNTTTYVIGPNLQYTLPKVNLRSCHHAHWGSISYVLQLGGRAVHGHQLRPRSLSSGDPSGGEVFEIAFEDGMAFEQPQCFV